MIKITIDGDEVYSAKDFTIKEEMLNTPSVILNNVYPISWEQDRDYVSRFYHPNDYSKCLIMNNTHIPEEPGITVTSTSINADVDTSKKYEYALMGDTQQSLPSGYTQVDYIESSRTQYIDTGVNADSNLRVVLDMAYSDNLSTSSRAMVGTIKSNGSNYIRYHFSLSGGGAWQAYFVTKIKTWGTSDLNRHIFDFDAPNKVCKVDNNSSGTFDISSFDTTLNYWLFGRNSDKDNLKAYNATKIYNAKFYYNNTLVRNFVPCLNNSNVAGLYDTVEGKFYENNGTGTFAYGSVAPNPNTPVAIDTVTGGQTIKVTGKNLFEDEYIKTTGNTTNINATLMKGTYTLSLSNSSNFGGNVYIQLYNENAMITERGHISSVTPNNFSSSSYWYYFTTTNINNLVFTIDDNYNVKIALAGATGTQKAQVEKSSTATTYEPYKSQTYEINLGKNLFDKNNANVMSAYLNGSGVITTNNPDKLIYIKCKPNTTYTLQKMLQGTTSYNRFRVGSTKELPVASLRVKDMYRFPDGTTNTTLTFTTCDDAQYLIFYCYRTDTETTFEEMLDSIQIEEGSQATSYSAYKTPIELCKLGDYQDFIRKGTGKNLFDKDNANLLNAYTSSTITSNANSRTLYIPCKPNTTYTISRQTIGKRFQAGTTDVLPDIDVSVSNLTPSDFSNELKSITLTTDSNSKYLVVFYSNTLNNNNYTEEQLRETIQIEESDTPTLFEPYGYKDKWYIYKQIGKIVLDGTEEYVRSSNAGNLYSFALTKYANDTNKSDKKNILSNRLLTSETRVAYSAFVSTTTGSISITVPTNVVSSYDTAQFKAYLKSLYDNNTPIIIYIPLATPTITEITNTELINQLESIELYNGTNNIMVSGYLPSPIQLHYNYVIEEDISDLLFCGVVKNSGYISLNPRHPHYQTLQILDFKTFLSEGETLDFVIANKTIEEAIEQVISTIEPYGFIKGNIQLLNSSDVIGAYSTKDKTAYDVFNYIADITQSRWTTRLIDENTVAIDFYDPTLLPEGSSIDYTQNYFDENLIDDISYSYGSNDYRNKQIMTSSEVYGSILQSQTIVANGYQTQFATELKIGKISSITINGNQMTFATNQEKELGYTADFYYTPGNNYFESADLRSTGQIIIISYLAIVEGRQIITNGTEIDRVATSTGRKGVVARYEDRNDATTSTELQLIGQSYIKYKGVPEIKLNVTTRKNLWNIGDRVTFNAPITELATEYMVKKKEIQRVFANPSSEEVIFYKFELSSSFNMEQAINYFDNQRAKAKGNIGEGEYISRNVDIENIANVIFYDGTCEEVTVDGDNTLNSVLNSPFIN